MIINEIAIRLVLGVTLTIGLLEPNYPIRVSKPALKKVPLSRQIQANPSPAVQLEQQHPAPTHPHSPEHTPPTLTHPAPTHSDGASRQSHPGFTRRMRS